MAVQVNYCATIVRIKRAGRSSHPRGHAGITNTSRHRIRVWCYALIRATFRHTRSERDRGVCEVRLAQPGWFTWVRIATLQPIASSSTCSANSQVFFRWFFSHLRAVHWRSTDARAYGLRVTMCFPGTSAHISPRYSLWINYCIACVHARRRITFE